MKLFSILFRNVLSWIPNKSDSTTHPEILESYSPIKNSTTSDSIVNVNSTKIILKATTSKPEQPKEGQPSWIDTWIDQEPDFRDPSALAEFSRDTDVSEWSACPRHDLTIALLLSIAVKIFCEL